MAKYINLDKLLEKLEDERPINWTDSEYEDGEQTCFEYTLEVIKEQPTADVVEVVRCKDCLYATERYGKLECINGISYRNSYNKPGMFCSYGERKEGDEK